jgi:hypothetical protein
MMLCILSYEYTVAKGVIDLYVYRAAYVPSFDLPSGSGNAVPARPSRNGFLMVNSSS